MSDFAFDVLGYTQNMESAGLTRQQAEAIATGMTSMIAQQFDSLLTTKQFEAAMERIDNRFVAIESKQDATDKRLDQIDRHLSNNDNKFLNIEAKLGQFDEVKSQVNLHTWMLALVIIVLVVPQLQRWFAVV